MKTKKSILNLTVSLISNIFIILVSFVAQKYFIKFLGTEYLGLNSLFKNIISMLNIVELGIGSAIIYNLYKPLVENDQKKMSALMSFYKKAYRCIAAIILSIGAVLVFFLNYFVGELSIETNIYIIYFLFLNDSILSYLLSYKRSILYADQKNYIINFIHMFSLIALNVSQIAILYLTRSYYLYLILKIVLQVAENLIITVYVNKKYTFLKVNQNEKLDKATEKDIFTKIKALFVHKIGTFIIQGTDNIIISKFLGIATVGLYSNYYLIINSVQNLFIQAIKAVTPSVGNMLIEGNREKNYNIFKKIRFVNFWMSTFSGVCILTIINSFIKIWLGAQYLLEFTVVIILVINYYQKMMRATYDIFKDAAGIYYEDRFVPLVESALNIVVSIILVRKIGLPGVFIGTIASGLALWCYSYPKYVYKNIFRRSYKDYTLETISYFILFIIIATISLKLTTLIVYENIFIDFIKNVIISSTVSIGMLLIIFFKSENLGYIIDILKRKK